MRQDQFLEVVDEATARRRFEALCRHLLPTPETVALAEALGRVLAADVTAAVDVPAFDRSNMDGFAVRAADTVGARELEPVSLDVADLRLAAGQPPPAGYELAHRSAVPIATGGVIPRGADAVAMIEHTRSVPPGVEVSRAVAPGENITFAGSDVGRGEVVARRGAVLSSRETGVLAAVGVDRVEVFRKPRVAVVSTGDEIVSPGRPLALGQVYDSNQRVLVDAVDELGCRPVPCGVVPDDPSAVEDAVADLLSGPSPVDLVLLSGGTSKGEGDINAAAIRSLADRLPDSAGIVAHGVALKPGKPILLAGLARRPVVVLPGFPTSAIFTFHEFVAPLLRRLSGHGAPKVRTVDAALAVHLTSSPGRTEYSLVDLVNRGDGLAAYPLGAGSGSVTAFARADGFIRIPADTEYVPEGSTTEVRLIDPGAQPADLVAIGSHCVGFDLVLGEVSGNGFRVKAIPVGSTAGLAALSRAEGDVAGIHLLDEVTGEYNLTFLPQGVRLVPGYRRRQGIAFRPGDPILGVEDETAFLASLRDSPARMVNRNPGSGTRVLIDRMLAGARPEGYLNQPRTHHAVAAAVQQGRADWGMTLEPVARAAGLSFRFVATESYDVAIRAGSWDRPAVVELRRLLSDSSIRSRLADLGFEA